MLRLLNSSFTGDIHWFFFIANIKIGNMIHRFCLPMPFQFRKHKGHDLAYDIKIMTLSRGYQALCQVHFCRTMFVDIADTTVPNLIYV